MTHITAILDAGWFIAGIRVSKGRVLAVAVKRAHNATEHADAPELADCLSELRRKVDAWEADPL